MEGLAFHKYFSKFYFSHSKNAIKVEKAPKSKQGVFLMVRDESDVEEEGGEGEKNCATAADKDDREVATLSFGVLKLPCRDANERVNVELSMGELSSAATIQARIPGSSQRKKNELER